MTSGQPATSNASEAAEVGKPSDTDATWAAMMIPHHQTGIAMAEMAADKAETDALRRAAEESRRGQEEDLPRLHKIIDAAGKSPMSPEKQIEEMNQHEMDVLESLSGADFDRHWITVVSGHHMAAIMMTETAMTCNASQEASALQKKIRTEQLGEIDTLTSIHTQLGH